MQSFANRKLLIVSATAVLVALMIAVPFGMLAESKDTADIELIPAEDNSTAVALGDDYDPSDEGKALRNQASVIGVVFAFFVVAVVYIAVSIKYKDKE